MEVDQNIGKMKQITLEHIVWKKMRNVWGWGGISPTIVEGAVVKNSLSLLAMDKESVQEIAHTTSSKNGEYLEMFSLNA